MEFASHKSPIALLINIVSLIESGRTMAMLQLTNVTQRLVALRINGERADTPWQFLCRRPAVGWLSMQNRACVSSAGAIVGNETGNRLVISLVPGVEANLYVADTRTNRMVGSIEFARGGGYHVRDTPQHDVLAEMTDAERVKMLAIIGFEGPNSVNLYDFITKDEDILRVKENETKIFVPGRYLKQVEGHEFNVTLSPLSFALPPLDQPSTSTAHASSATVPNPPPFQPPAVGSSSGATNTVTTPAVPARTQSTSSDDDEAARTPTGRAYLRRHHAKK